MNRRAFLHGPLFGLAFVLTIAASSAHAATATAPAKAAVSPWKSSTPRPRTASVHVVPPAPATASTQAVAPAPSTATTRAVAPARATATTSANASPAGTSKAPRRLEDVSIEGEVPVPQVLFVTAREQRRGIEFQQHRYLPNARALGESTPLPRWIATPQNPPPSR